MRALVIRVTDSDVRVYPIADGYRYGIYLERDRPAPDNRRNNLCVYRVPAGMRAPLGRIPDEMLLALAEEAAKPEAQPEVVARLPFWSYIENNGVPVDVADDTEAEPLAVLPSSQTSRDGHFVQPPDAFTPVKPAAKKGK